MALIIHGLSNTYVEEARRNAIKRCYDHRHNHFSDYGGRGILVCEGLRTSTTNWISILGHRPTPKHSVNRINNDGHYSCGQCAECFKCGHTLNVEWATAITQARNKRNNRRVTIDGVNLTSAEWQERLGLTRQAFEWRYMPDKRDYFRRIHDADYWREYRRQKKEKVQNA